LAHVAQTLLQDADAAVVDAAEWALARLKEVE
jgi:hypothetical protein